LGDVGFRAVYALVEYEIDLSGGDGNVPVEQIWRREIFDVRRCRYTVSEVVDGDWVRWHCDVIKRAGVPREEGVSYVGQ
jgi:hypothetical protein